MKAEVISIGTELLLGEIVDTNTPYIAGQLALLGIDLNFASTVGDNPDRLSYTLQRAWERSDVVFTTGGLGPTQDDITRDTIAALMGEELSVDEALKQDITSFFAGRGLEMPVNNIRQATVIPSAKAIPNPQGTAPGWWVEKDGRIIVAMPGPPREMEYMWSHRVFPWLQAKTGGIILCRMIKTFGLSEAKVDEMVAHLLASSNPSIGVYAKLDGIYLRIAAKAARREEAEAMISAREAEVREILGDCIWGIDDETQEGVVGKLLVDRSLSLAVAESFTGGFLAHTLGTTVDSERFFKGGMIIASDAAKIALGLDPALVAAKDSAETARAMAALARRKMEASIGIGIEGEIDAEPETGIIPGTIFIAIDRGPDEAPLVQSYSGRLYQMKRRAGYYALFDLMKLLQSM